MLNAEYGNVGNAGQGWTHNNAPTTGLTTLIDDYTSHFYGTLRFPSPSGDPDYVVVNTGANDFLNQNTPAKENEVTASAVGWLTAVYSYFPTSKVFLVVPFGGFEKDALHAAFTQYVGANPKTNVSFVNLGPTAATGISGITTPYNTPQSVDGIHPYAGTQNLLGFQLAAAIQVALGKYDFDGDGKSDLVVQSSTSNAIGIWRMNGSQVNGSVAVTDIPNPSYRVVGVGDFNGDGNPDIVFQNIASGTIAIWYMNNSVHIGGAQLPNQPGSDYKVVGIGDFNGDGKADIAFQSQSSNNVVIWYMIGTQVVGSGSVDAVPDAGYKVVGLADFNRDGQTDLIFQNSSSGVLAIWYLSGLHRASGETVNCVPPPGFNVEAVTDLDGDGRPDVVLRNPAGDVRIWHLDNSTLYSAEATSVPLSDTTLRIAGPR